MVYHFPDLEVLRLALTSGAVPPATALAPVRARHDAGGWHIEPARALPKKADAELRRLGVAIDRDARTFDIEAGHWLQLFPLVPDPRTADLAGQTPVLFDLSEADFPALVAEMLRLGNDRQAFRVLGEGRVLLRVIGPPYYSLLRALDRDGQAAAPVAYLERRPRIWVRLGYTHPLLETITPAAGEMLLLGPPHQWSAVPEGPFRDIYEVLDFPLPHAAAPLPASTLSQPIRVPLQLTASGFSEAAELWVLNRQPIEQVDRLVRDLDETILDRLAFAVGQPDSSEPIVVIRARPSRQPPPVLVLDALPCRHYLKLANLFVPVGRRIRPPLRRDALRRLLAPDPEQVVWLAPGAGNDFTPQQLPDAAFRPLRDWVDYVLDHDHEALSTWVQSTRFDFEPFVCTDERPAPAARTPRKRRRDQEPAAPPAVERTEPTTPPAQPEASREPMARPVTRKTVPLDQTQLELARLEQEFLHFPGPLDSPQRQALWPRLAELNAALARRTDAALCWINAHWETDKFPPCPGEPAVDVETILAREAPTADELRSLAIRVIQDRALAARLASRLRPFFDQHDAGLPVRLLWLTWLTLAGDDALGLARARDRILDRLLTGGLNHELDLPAFLRFERGDRQRLVGDRLHRLHDLACTWIRDCSRKALKQAGAEPTVAYIDLIFAYALARLGRGTACRDLLAQAAVVFAHPDEVHEWLHGAFRHRIEQVLAGLAPVGPFPADFQAKLEMLSDPANKEAYSGLDPRYKIDSLRNRLRILEPQESVDPYRRFAADEVEKEVYRWSSIQDSAELVERVRKIWKKVRTVDSRYKVVKGALRLAPRTGTELTLELLDQVLPILEALPEIHAEADLAQPTELLERALFLAAHHDRGDLVQAMMNRTYFYLDEARRIGGKLERLENVTAQSLRGLRRLGLAEAVAQLLDRMAQVALHGKSLPELRAQLDDGAWSTTMVTLLHLAGGWLSTGRPVEAAALLAAGRELLLGGKLDRPGGGHLKMKIARAYVAALAEGDPEAALAGIEELFQGMGGFHEIGTHNSHYFVLQLQFVEAVVLAVASDDFALGQVARRWLEEDEYLVRRRIHRDVRQRIG